MNRLLLFTAIMVYSIGSISAVEKETSYLVILGGGKTLQDAETAWSKWESNTELVNKFNSNYDIVKSDSIEGLNPGFYILILGYSKGEKLANVAVKIANNYTKGVYIREVKVLEEVYVGSTFSINSEKPMFSGERFMYKYNQAIIDYNNVAYTERVGSFNVNYYLSWSSYSKEILHLSDLDFVRIVARDDDELINCDRTEHEVYTQEGDPWNGFIESEETCYYESGITTVLGTGIESSWEQVTFPGNKYSYREVLFYLLQDGHFSFLLEHDLGKGAHEFENEYIEVYDNRILITDSHWEELLHIEDGNIVYASGGGA